MTLHCQIFQWFWLNMSHQFTSRRNAFKCSKYSQSYSALFNYPNHLVKLGVGRNFLFAPTFARWAYQRNILDAQTFRLNRVFNKCRNLVPSSQYFSHLSAARLTKWVGQATHLSWMHFDQYFVARFSAILHIFCHKT